MKILLIIATFYSNSFIGKKTASGQLFSQTNYTCATNMYPLGSLLKVTNMSNGKSVEVTVNDRCLKNNIVDMSKISFNKISSLKNGRAEVTVTRKNKRI